MRNKLILIRCQFIIEAIQIHKLGFQLKIQAFSLFIADRYWLWSLIPRLTSHIMLLKIDKIDCNIFDEQLSHDMFLLFIEHFMKSAKNHGKSPSLEKAVELQSIGVDIGVI